MFSLFRSSAIGIVVKAQGDVTHYSPARSADVLRYTRRGIRQVYGLAQKLLKITASSRTIKNRAKKKDVLFAGSSFLDLLNDHRKKSCRN